MPWFAWAEISCGVEGNINECLDIGFKWGGVRRTYSRNIYCILRIKLVLNSGCIKIRVKLDLFWLSSNFLQDFSDDFHCSLEFVIWLRFHFGHVWSNSIFKQVWSILDNFDPFWTSMIHFRQAWSIWTNLIQFGQVWNN